MQPIFVCEADLEQLQAIVLPENAHNTSGLLKKFKISNTRALSLTPWQHPSHYVRCFTPQPHNLDSGASPTQLNLANWHC